MLLLLIGLWASGSIAGKSKQRKNTTKKQQKKKKHNKSVEGRDEMKKKKFHFIQMLHLSDESLVNAIPNAHWAYTKRADTAREQKKIYEEPQTH